MISDKAKACPKCGAPNISESASISKSEEAIVNDAEKNVYPGGDKYSDSGSQSQEDPKEGKSHKKLYLLLILLIVLIGGGTGYYLYSEHLAKLEQERLERLEAVRLEQLRQDSIKAAQLEAARIDSIYRNFTSQDLKLFQAKGHVKMITMKINGSWDEETISENWVINFDKDGNAISIKIDGTKYNFKRNNQNQIYSLAYSNTDGPAIHYADTEWTLTYKDLSLTSVSLRDDLHGLNQTSKCVFQYLQNNLYIPSIIRISGEVEHGGGFDPGGTDTFTCSLTCNYTPALEFNWELLKLSGSMTYNEERARATEDYDYKSEIITRKSTPQLSISRQIEFYAPEEVNLDI